MKGHNPIQRYSWNFDLLSQLVFFVSEPVVTSTSSQRAPSFTPLACIILQGLISFLVCIESKQLTSLPNIIRLPLFDEGVKSIPLVIKGNENALLHLKRRMLTRLGPFLSQFFNRLCHPLVKLIASLSSPNVKLDNKIDKAFEAMKVPLEKFAVQFIGCIVAGLRQVLTTSKGGRSNDLLKLEDILLSLSTSPMQGADTIADPGRSGLQRMVMVVTSEGENVSATLHDSHHLSGDEIQTCLLFGSLSSHLILKLSQWISSQTQEVEALDFPSVRGLSIIIETMLSIMSFTCLLFTPFFTGWRWPPVTKEATKDAFRRTENTGLNQTDTMYNNDETVCPQIETQWGEEEESDCRAALDLMKQFNSSCYPQIIRILGLDQNNEVLELRLINMDNLSQILQEIADVIPSILLFPLSPVNIVEERVVLKSERSPPTQIGRFVAQGLRSSVFLSLWKCISRHTSVKVTDLLVKEALDLKDAEDNEGNEKEGGNEYESSPDETDKSETDEDYEKSEPKNCQGTKALATTTDASSDSEPDQATDDDEKEGELEEIDESQLLGFLLNNASLSSNTEEALNGSASKRNEKRSVDESNPLSTLLQKKRTRQIQHLRRIQIQTKLRGLDMVVSLLDGKLLYLLTVMSLEKDKTNEIDVKTIISLVLQQFRWIATLNDGLRLLLSKLARKIDKKQNELGIKKRETMKLELEMSKRLEKIGVYQCQRMMSVLSMPHCFEKFDRATSPGCFVTIVEETLKSSREICYTLAKGLCKFSQEFPKMLAPQATK